MLLFSTPHVSRRWGFGAPIAWAQSDPANAFLLCDVGQGIGPAVTTHKLGDKLPLVTVLGFARHRIKLMHWATRCVQIDLGEFRTVMSDPWE